ncbi:MAG TPA: heparan-alpha-glucosaminide N-acetyltransferase domain-containing protein [Polyangia bacterium]|nr:heparan-alpha-glucosaminide N-acetyltransferase domain-containing protein [Polyangia bacterium]
MAGNAPGSRIACIDRLRGLAVLGMFLVHSGPPWLAAEHRGGTYSRALGQIAGMVAPVFLFLAGVAVAAVARRAPAEPSPARRRVIVRGLLIVAAGYGLQVVFWAARGFTGLDRVLKVDVLHCIGASMALLALLAWPKGRWNAAAAAGFAILLLGAQVTWRLPLAEWLQWPLAAWFTRHAGHSLFPLLPYGAWIALGLFVGPLWLALREAGRERRFLVGLGIAAAATVGLSFAAGLAERVSGLSALPGPDGRPVTTTVSFFLLKGAGVMALLLLARLLDGPLASWRRDPLLLLGRTSLFAYCVHLVLVYHGLAWTFAGRLTPPQHLAAVVGLAAVMLGLCWVWKRWRRRRQDAARTTDSTLRTLSDSQGR